MVDLPGVWREMINTARAGRRYVDPGELNLAAHSLILLEYQEA
jgi:hypothetical protein